MGAQARSSEPPLAAASRRRVAPLGWPRAVIEALADWAYGYDLFISYGHADFAAPEGDGAAAAEPAHYPTELARKLRGRGYRVFLDRDEYGPGEVLPRATRRRVRMSRHLAILAAPRALASEWVALEARLFLERGGGRGPAPMVINFDQALQSFAPTSPLAAQALRDSWIYIEDARREGRARPSDWLVAQLARRMTGLKKDRLRVAFFAAVAAVMSVVAVVAALQWMRADRERRSADRAAAAALQGVDAILEDLTAQAKVYEGVPTRVIAGALAKADGVLEALDAIRPSDAVALRAGAVRSGAAQARQRLRDFAAARAQAVEAIRRLDALADAPDERDAAFAAELRAARARAWLTLGGVESAQERGEAARAALRAAVDILEGPDNLAGPENLAGPGAPTRALEHALLAATARFQLGTAHLLPGPDGAWPPPEAIDAALAAYGAALEHARAARAIAPSSPRAAVKFIEAARSEADLRAPLGARDAARALYQEAIEVGRAALAAEEADADVELRRVWAGALQGMAALTAAGGGAEAASAAAALMERAFAEDLRVARSDPENGAFRERLSYAALESARMAAAAGASDAGGRARRAVSIAAAHLSWSPAPERLFAADFDASLQLAAAESAAHARLLRELTPALSACRDAAPDPPEEAAQEASQEASQEARPDARQNARQDAPEDDPGGEAAPHAPAPPPPLGAPDFESGDVGPAARAALKARLAQVCG